MSEIYIEIKLNQVGNHNPKDFTDLLHNHIQDSLIQPMSDKIKQKLNIKTNLHEVLSKLKTKFG